VEHYAGLARRYGTLVSGGSDFHGEDPAQVSASRGRRATLGVVTLPPEALAALEARARHA
jgi:hypothetical protein